MSSLLVHTDFGHDPDDAIALAYLYEHEVYPDIISITPGHIQQQEALSGFLNLYCGVSHPYKQFPKVYTSKPVVFNENFMFIDKKIDLGHHDVSFVIVEDCPSGFENFKILKVKDL